MFLPHLAIIVGGNRKNINVVIADDSPNDVVLIRLALLATGLDCQVNMVTTGKQLLEFLTYSNGYARNSHVIPDFVLIDTSAPHMNGHSVLLLMQMAAELRSIPVYVLSGIASDADQKNLLDSGVRKYYNKPAEPEAYYRIIREILADIKLLN